MTAADTPELPLVHQLRFARAMATAWGPFSVLRLLGNKATATPEEEGAGSHNLMLSS